MGFIIGAVGVGILLYPLWMILYWIPRCDAVGIKKAKERIPRETAR